MGPGSAPVRCAHLRCARPHRPVEDISIWANQRTFLLWSYNGNNEIDVKGRRIYFNGTLIGKSKGGRGAANPDLVITLTGSATTAAVDNLVRRLNFQAKGDVGTTRTINVQLTNIGGVDSNVATRDIAVVNN